MEEKGHLQQQHSGGGEHLEVAASQERRDMGAGGARQTSGHEQASEHRQLASLEEVYDVET